MEFGAFAKLSRLGAERWVGLEIPHLGLELPGFGLMELSKVPISKEH